MTNSKKIVVTGDVVFKNDIFKGSRTRSDSTEGPGTTKHRTRAGACLVHDLLKGVAAKDEELEAILGIELGGDSERRTAYRLWRECGRGKKKVWGLSEHLGYGTPDSTPSRIDARDIPADVLVIEDAGIGFRHDMERQAWRAEIRGNSDHEPEG